MLNQITIMGRLTKDPELRQTNSGVSVASFSLAVERDLKDASGERKTDFIEVAAWRGTGEFVDRYFHKGDMAIVRGRLEINEWTAKDGGNRRTARVVAENVYFGTSKKSAPQPERVNVPEAHGFADISADDDPDLPF